MSNKPKAKSPKPKATIEDLYQQIAQLTEALQHERADAENIRRRHDEQIAGLREMVKASMVRELLPVIDNIDRAITHCPPPSTDGSQSKAWEDWAKGVVGVKVQFDQVLQTLGVERIKTVGEPFDPHLHEAISMDDTGGHHEIVSEELQTGYVLGDNIIRHAMVKVRTESAHQKASSKKQEGEMEK